MSFFSKKTQYLNLKITVQAIVIISVFLYLTKPALAAWDGNPYQTGETLNPECNPSQTSCTVIAPLSSSGNSNLFDGALSINPSSSDPAGLVINPFGENIGNTGELRLTELAANGANYTGFKSPDSLGSNIIYTLPNVSGTNNQVLSTNGNGALSWVTMASGGTSAIGQSVSGSSGLGILFTDTNGVLTQDATKFNYDPTGDGKLTVKGTIDPKAFSADDFSGGAGAYYEAKAGQNAAVASAGVGRLRYNALTNQFEISENGGTYNALKLTGSQEEIITFDSSGRQTAAPASGLSIIGDVSGTLGATSVDKLKGSALTLTSLVTNNLLQYNGTDWTNVTPVSLGSITLATGTTGTDVNVSGSPASLGGTLTLNIPDASVTARGLVTTDAQIFAGNKTFNGDITVAGNIMPATGEMYDLGSLEKPFRTLFINGSSIMVDGVRLSNTSGVLNWAGQAIKLRSTTSTSSELTFTEMDDGDPDTDENTLTLKSPESLDNNLTLILPDSVGANGQVLKTDGTGALSWVTPLTEAITSLNGLTNSVQTFSVGTSGTNFNIASSGNTHTFNIPNASSSARGLLTSSDWTVFNNKVSIGRQILAGVGLSGGGDLSADRTLALDLNGLSSVSSVGGSDYLPVYLAGSSEHRKISYNDLFSSVLGSLNYRGTWNATTNNPSLDDTFCSTGTKGYYYVVSTAGVTSLGGISTWNPNDWVICNGSDWERMETTNYVASVFGRLGTVTAQAGDYTASQITSIPAGSLSATNVQAALNELDGEKIASLNGLATNTQTFALGTSGADVNISSNGSVHTFNFPNASATARGLVTVGAQTLAGAKTFSSAPILSSMTAGSVFFAGSGGTLTEDNSNLFWDDTNNRLGIGTTNPSANVQIHGGGGPGRLTITGGGMSYTQANILLQSGNTIGRGAGIYTYNTVANRAWYFGNPYTNFDTGFVINRKKTSGFGDEVASFGHTNTENLFMVSNSGNVGIGTAWPATKLDVAGDLRLQAQGDLRLADADSSNYIAFQAPETVASNVTWTLPAADGSSGQILNTDGSGALSWVTPLETAITSLNGLTAISQTFATGATGTDFNIASSGDTHTFNIPDASASARGMVTKDAQTFGGDKTFVNNLLVNGNVGIGSVSFTPTQKLDVRGNGYFYAGANTSLDLYGDTTSSLTIQGANNTVGIPVATLNLVAPSMRAKGIKLGADVSGSSNYWYAGVPYSTLDGRFIIGYGTSPHNSALLNIVSSGNVGIGTIPDTKLDVAGDMQLRAQGDVRLADSDSSNYVALQAPSTISSNVTWTLPAADGTDGQAISTNGSGSLEWSSILTPTLTSGNIFVGNSSDIATAITLSGDATISNTGSLTLANSGVTAGSYGSAAQIPVLTVDGKGRVTVASTSAITRGNVVSDNSYLLVSGGTNAVWGSGVTLDLGTGAITAPSNPEITITGGTGAVLGGGVAITIPDVSTTTRGLVTTSAQNFSGLKNFTSGVTVAGSASFSTALNMNSNKIINLTTPTSPNDAANKAYIDALTGGVIQQQPVLGLTGGIAPSSPNSGDRYILQDGATGFGSCQTNQIAQWDGSTWVCDGSLVGTGNPSNGWTTNVAALGQNYSFNGTDWVAQGTTVSHLALINLQGGASDEYYHLNLNDYNALTAGTAQLTALQTSGSPVFAGLTITGTTKFNGITYTWPATQAAGRVLSTNGSGTLSWIPALTSDLASSKIFVGNGAGEAAAVNISGDATLANTGALTIASGVITSAKIADGTIVNADVNASANIELSKLAGGNNIVTSLAAPSGSNANAGSIANNLLTLAFADKTNPGIISTGSQTLGGIKTFDGVLFNKAADAVLGFNYPDTTYDRRLRLTAGKSDTADNSQGASIDLHGNDLGGNLDLVAGGADGVVTMWTNDVPQMMVDAIGNVGIGTISPATKLDVAGDLRLQAQGALRLADNDSSHYIALQAPSAITSNLTLTLPATAGSSGQALTTNGSGVLSWSSILSPTLSSGNIFVGNTSNVATGVAMNGDATISNAGALTIAANAVALGTDTTGNYVAGNTAGTGITISGTAGEGWLPTIAVASTVPMAVSNDTNITGVLASNTLTLGWTGQLGIARGGTNIATYATGDLLYASAANTLAKKAIGSNGQVLTVSGGVPTWSAPSACPTCFVNNGNSFGTLAVLGTNDNQSLAFETNNTERVRITNDGNVGIGTNAPEKLLEIADSTANRAQLRLKSSGNVGEYGGIEFKAQHQPKAAIYFERGLGTSINGDGYYSTGKLHFVTDSVHDNQPVEISDSKMVIDHDGKVGIGVISPSEKLDIAGNTRLLKTNTATATTQYASGDLKLQSSSWDTALNDGDGGESVNNFSLRSTGLSGENASYRFGILNNDGTELLSVRENGNVGIGTANPSEKLHISGGNLLITSNGSTADNTTNTYTKGLTITGGNMRLVIDASNVANEGAYIQTRHILATYPSYYYSLSLNPLGGNVGIGTTSPATKLDIAGDLRLRAQGDLRLSDADSSHYIALQAPPTVAANVTLTLPSSAGSSGQMLSTDGSGILSWTTPLTTAITSLNGLTEASQTFATGTTGTDFNIASSGSAHTFNIPSASATARGLVTTDAQAFAGVKTFSNNVIVNSNVGIGIADPAEKLDMIGNLRLSTATATQDQLLIKPNASGSNRFVGTLTSADLTTTATWTLPNVSGTIYTSENDPMDTIVEWQTLCANCVDIIADTSGTLTVARGGTGTNNGSITGSGALTFAAGGTNQNVTLTPSGTGYTLLNGNVGVGTISPARRLDVSGNGTSIWIAGIANTANTEDAHVLRLLGGQNTPTSVDGDGYITSGASHYITFARPDGAVIGSIRQDSASSILIADTSDARLKTNITDSLSGLETIKNIQVRDFAYRDDPKKTTRQGFIAQELYNVYPQAVSVGGDDPRQNPWGVDYGKLTPLLVKSVQELSNRTRSLNIENDQSIFTGTVYANNVNGLSQLVSSLSSSTQPTQILPADILDTLQQASAVKLSGKLLVQGDSTFEGVVTLINQATFKNTASFLADVNFAKAVVFENDVLFKGRLAFEDQDMAGYVKIASGRTEVKVVFEKEYSFTPIIQITPLGKYDTKYWVADVTSKGFSVKIDPSLAEESQFTWSALAVKDPRTTESEPGTNPSNSQPTDGSQPTSSPSSSPTTEPKVNQPLNNESITSSGDLSTEVIPSPSPIPATTTKETREQSTPALENIEGEESL